MRNLNHTIVRIIAGSIAIVSLFVCMFGPIIFFRLNNGIPFEAKGPSWETWALIIGGGLGAGLARFLHDATLSKIGVSQSKIDENWYGRSK